MRQRPFDFAGMDVVRLFATGLVTIQHALTLVGREDQATILGLSIGQLGVALFLAVSGLLASESRRPPFPWLVRRLWRVYPAYWLVIGASFFLAWMVGYKRFGMGQVAAQFAGIGLFTHANNLVNTPTWFVSLLLVCYAGTFAARLLLVQHLAGAVASIVFAILVATDPNAWLLAHFLTYSVASTIALIGKEYRPRVAWLTVGILLPMAIWWQRAFGYTAVSILVVELSLMLRTVPHWVRVAAEYSYEYFLVHGLALFGMLRMLPSAPWVSVGLAILLAAGAAVAVHRMVEIARQAVIRKWNARSRPLIAVQADSR